MKRFSVWLLRHGKTEGPAALNGHFDAKVPLATQLEIKHRLEHSDIRFSHLISSPLSRCLDLAQLISGEQDVHINPDWSEMKFGDYDGVAFDSIPKQNWPHLEKFWQDPEAHPLPNAETTQAFYQRVSQSWDEQLTSFNGDTLIVTHGGVIRMLLAHILNLPWNNPALFTKLAISNQSLTQLDVFIDESVYVTVKSIGVTL